MLTDVKVRTAKPREKSFKLADANRETQALFVSFWQNLSCASTCHLGTTASSHAMPFPLATGGDQLMPFLFTTVNVS